MTSFETFTDQSIPLSISRLRREWEELLLSRGLQPVDNPAFVAGLYNGDEKLVATGSLVRTSSGYIVEGLAVAPDYESGGLIFRILSSLQNYAAQDRAFGYSASNLLLYTKPQYGGRFICGAGFSLVGEGENVVLLESGRRFERQLIPYLKKHRREGSAGVIVMNGNPPTAGHRYLVQTAAAQVDNLFIIPVLDDTPGGFPYKVRLSAMRQAFADIPGVEVLEGNRYTVSAATFPTYFIKEISSRTDAQITLDLDIFASHIAPALGATVRFVGSEPTDNLTARYNELMHTLLPARGIEVREIQRMESGGKAISASRVRNLLGGGDLVQAAALLPAASTAAILANLACGALYSELEADPKPGLVTPHSSGSHSDMSYGTMQSSIEALRDSFSQFALLQLTGSYSHQALVNLGLEAERKMLEATHGVNTHKGAIFALGLMISAAAKLIHDGIRITTKELSKNIAQLASPFQSAHSSHGAKARAAGLKSALEMAKEGYPQLFQSWLPQLRSLMAHSSSSPNIHFLLLNIISSLDDTNIYYRGGAEALAFMKTNARRLLDFYTVKGMSEFCRQAEQRNLSPGGAADMMALTFLANSLA